MSDLDINLNPNVNALSGTNGTCKTSLLHMISNAFQSVTKKCDWLKDKNCMTIINAVNNTMNAKIESLTRGDKKYNDPAYGVKGTLFTIRYLDGQELEFRRHNSGTTRYALKPKYEADTSQKLPYCPVIYLGLSRLVPYGEYRDDLDIKKIEKRLPEIYQNEIAELYKKFTNYTINNMSAQKMGKVKTRTEFDCTTDGIDSNTISAGEDNLYILLTALVSLKYYYENIESSKEVESILLIDEVDATLHPAYQIKLLDLFKKYSIDYRIQIIFTTHSLSLLQSMLAKKDNVIYLLDNITNVIQMDDPDIYKIKMHLQSLTEEDIYQDCVIPLFSEDDEARFMIRELFTYFIRIHKPEFNGIERFFHLVDAKISADNLTGIFKDDKLQQIALRSICILDTDKKSDISRCIVALPHRKSLSPEEMIFDYAQTLYKRDSDFWTNSKIIEKGYGKIYYINNIKNPIDEFEKELEDMRSQHQSTKGKRREFYKKFFNNHKSFIKCLYRHWLYDKDNQLCIEHFYQELRTVFKKVAPYNEINPNEWK